MAGDTVITVQGNLTSDPELRFTPQGKPVASFTVASTPRRFDRQTNTWVDGEALFLRCSAWNALGEHVAESLTRGAKVVVVGRLVQRSYETQQGEKRTVVEVQAEDVAASLMFATAKVNRVNRNGSGSANNGFGSSTAGDDPWGSAASAETAFVSAAAGGFGASGEDAPF
ncbi:single-stranded DNA-binding protein [Nocardia vinacea]|uniref:single-stranded DNA-binding protein n=1 Tax=Nocardia vinacea TaxID=96468 RepID=UPI002E0E91A7|nr:single-stranded DNA-binding protein [Nocardia vinacea]